MAYDPVPTFLQEAAELIAGIEQAALGLCATAAPAETVHEIFRAFHTIKGSGAMCGLDRVAGFTHHMEGLLEKVRDGTTPVSPSLAELILKATDHIKALLNAIEGGGAEPAGSRETLVEEIEQFQVSRTPDSPSAVDSTSPAAGNENAGECTWRISFRPNPVILLNGASPAALWNDLRNLGTCEVEAHTDEVPELDGLEPDRCYLWWTATLRTAAGEDQIRDVFIFVEDGSRLEIAALADALSNAHTDAPAGAMPDALRATPTVLQRPSDPACGPPPPLPPTREPLPAAAQPPESSPHKPAAREATVRVPAARLDRLVNLVGELVMNHSCLAQAASQSGAAELANAVQVLERLVAELRDNVLGIRMLPIGTLFGRFRRLVHDLSKELGKEVDLVTEGAETELDKSILDQLGEPLVHCLRNCLDHGIEPAAERMEKGKPRRAIIRLSAVHTGSNVVIRIEDDGRGIDRAAIRAKAIEKQLVAPDAVLSDKEILNLIVLPGFSTAREVTSVSGRGVGMDAVKRQIDLLHGSLSLASTEGRGTGIFITLPLTLAIIDGLLVEIAGEQLIIPMAVVTENVELTGAQKARNNGRNVIAVRGELLPYIDLRQAFRIRGEAPAIEKVVIVQDGDDRVGLIVDRVLGTHQTVIQSLGKFYKKVEVVSGATIMGDGRVAVILDIAAVVRHIDRQCRTAPPAAWADTEVAAAGLHHARTACCRVPAEPALETRPLGKD